MNILKSHQRGMLIGYAPSNNNQVIVFNGLWGCLKVLANAEKYFKVYYPDFVLLDWNYNKKRITLKELKESYLRYLKNYDPKEKYLSKNEIKELAKYFKINLEKNYPHFVESKTGQIVKGRKATNSNKRVKPYARKRK